MGWGSLAHWLTGSLGALERARQARADTWEKVRRAEEDRMMGRRQAEEERQKAATLVQQLAVAPITQEDDMRWNPNRPGVTDIFYQNVCKNVRYPCPILLLLIRLLPLLPLLLPSGLSV